MSSSSLILSQWAFDLFVTRFPRRKWAVLPHFHRPTATCKAEKSALRRTMKKRKVEQHKVWKPSSSIIEKWPIYDRVRFKRLGLRRKEILKGEKRRKNFVLHFHVDPREVACYTNEHVHNWNFSLFLIIPILMRAVLCAVPFVCASIGGVLANCRAREANTTLFLGQT